MCWYSNYILDLSPSQSPAGNVIYEHTSMRMAWQIHSKDFTVYRFPTVFIRESPNDKRVGSFPTGLSAVHLSLQVAIFSQMLYGGSLVSYFHTGYAEEMKGVLHPW